MGDFVKLEVWQRAHQLALRIYRLTQAFPRTEEWGLTSSFGVLRYPYHPT
jgi:hypothetical protein